MSDNPMRNRPTLRIERSKLPYFPPNASGDPRQLPELRRGLLDLAVEHGAWHSMEYMRTLHEAVGVPLGVSHRGGAIEYDDDGNVIVRGPAGYGADELGSMIQSTQDRGARSMDWYRRNLMDAQLIHVSTDLCEVLFSSLNSMPDDRVLQTDDPPSPAGFVVFETPWVGIDSGDEFETVRVDGVLWGPVLLPPKSEWATSMAHALPGFAIACFRFMDPTNQDDENVQADKALAAERGEELILAPQWLPLGRADWCIGDRIDDITHPGIDPESKVHESMQEDRKLVAALWALIAQRLLVERTTVTAPRHAAKRLERAGDSLPRTVEVIHLRRPEFAPRHEDGSTGRRIGVRYLTRPFWRNQPYGPSNALRKLILIAPHWRGPEGAPISNVERVWEVDR